MYKLKKWAIKQKLLHFGVFLPNFEKFSTLISNYIAVSKLENNYQISSNYATIGNNLSSGFGFGIVHIAYQQQSDLNWGKSRKLYRLDGVSSV